MNPAQKIIRVRENEAIRELDEYTETWMVVKTIGPAEDGWIYVLVERDEEQTAKKQLLHENYLSVVHRLV